MTSGAIVEAVKLAPDRSGMTARKDLPPLEDGLSGAALDEGRHAGRAVLGGEQGGKELALERKAGLEVDLDAAVDGFLRGPQRVGRPIRELRSPAVSGVVDVGRGHDLIDHADRDRLVGGDESAGEDQVFRLRGPHQPRQPLSAARARDDSEQDLGLTELGVVGGDPDVGAQRQLAPAAERISRDRRHDRLRDRRDGAERRLQPGDSIGHVGVGHLGHLFDVGAGREDLLAAPHHDTADVVSLGRLVRGRADLLLHLPVERVHRRPVKPQRRNSVGAVGNLEPHVLSHRREGNASMRTGQNGPMAPSADLTSVWPGQSRKLGATADDGGVNFTVWAPHAESVTLCLFDEAEHETRLDLWEHTLGFWNGYVPGVSAGQRYGFRASGQWDPANGRVFDADKLLLDPYARAIAGAMTPGAALASRTSTGERNPGDTSELVPRGVVVDGSFEWGDDRRPSVPWQNTVIYEAHVRGLTMRHPDVPERLRGTYAGLAHPSVVSYLLDLGVTGVELLPVHHFVSELDLTALGLVNYWGYNTVGYFAPHAAYSSAGSRGEQVREFKEMVKTLHEAGIEVILDVVYNHTAESAADGPTLSFRGFDEPAYYLTDTSGRYADVTGCGNTFNVSEPQALQLVMDSLRYWVTEMHVDGFRFDLAPALLRNGPRVDLRAPFLTAIHQDPVLRQVKLIAEPWDATGEGYLVGQFPPQWCEWNDKYRDTVRDFWRGQSDGVRELASRLSGSSDLYADDGRLPFASVNFVTAHDGFTLRDLVSYNVKHNLANGQDNRDGMDQNRSWNCGVEGETDDNAVTALRRRQAANLLTTLLLSTGVPMVSAGDERGRTQQGNNNAFCHDSELAWMSWAPEPEWQHLQALTRLLMRLRSEHPVLRQRFFFEGKPINGSDRKDITWLQPSGDEMNWTTWLDPGYRTLGVFIAGDQLRMFDARGRRRHDTSYVFWLHAGDDPIDVLLPSEWADRYVEVLRTDRLERLGDPTAVETLRPGSTVRLEHHTFAVYEAVSPSAP